jgi:3-(3-hydroxy-phenyl)propionate hydroxylase
VLPTDGDAQRLYGARPGTCFLVRPDSRVAGRWRQASTAQLRAALRHARGLAPIDQLETA